MTDEQIEQEIRTKGLTAPRITPEDVEAAIASEHYFTAEHGIEGAVSRGELWARHAAEWPGDTPMPYITHCVIILRNGHKIVGVNTGAVSNANFDPELARRLARQDAINQIWPLLGFALRERLAAAPMVAVDAQSGAVSAVPEAEAKLLAIVRAFVEKHHVSCPEVIHQSDRVIENAYELIEDLCEQVGYYQYPDEEEAS